MPCSLAGLSESILGRRNKCKLFEVETSMLYLRQRKVTSELFRVRRKMIEDQKSDLLRTCTFRF